MNVGLGPRESSKLSPNQADGESYIALFERAREGRVPEDCDVPGFNHVGFEVDDPDGTEIELFAC